MDAGPRSRRIPGQGIVAALLFVTAFLLPSLAGAQDRSATIRGFVTDESDGQALSGVNVVLRDPEGTLFGAATDSDGFYAVTRLAPGRYALRVSFIGYRTVADTVDLRPGENRTLNLALEPDQAELDEVVVESDAEGGAARVTAGVQTVRPQDLRVIPTPGVSGDLAAYLTTVPGVVTTGDRGGQFFIRGGEPSHTLTLLDGMYVYQPFHVLGFYSAFPSDILNSADVHAGGFGARYSGRISSIIDVKTRNGNKRSFEPSVSLSPFVTSGLFEGPLVRDRISFLASGRLSTVEEIASRYVNEPLPYRFGDLFGKVHAVLHDNHQLSVSALHTFDRGTLDRDARVGTADEIRWSNTVYGARYVVLPKILPILAEVLFSISNLQTELGPPGEPSRSSEIQSFNLAVNIAQYAGRSVVDWGFFLRAPTIQSELGGLYQNVASNYDRSPNPGFHVEPDLYLGRGLRLRPGIVGQLVGNKGFFLEPRLRAVWEGGPHRISAAGGLYRQDVVGLTDRRDVTNIFTAWTDTPLGRASRAVHALVGYGVTPVRGVDVAVEGFYKRLSSLYISEWTAFPRFTSRLQEASGDALGVDVRLEVRRGSFYGFVNYGLSSVEYEAMQGSLQHWFGTSRLAFRPPHDRRHQVNVLLSTTLREFDLSLRWNFGSGLPYTKVRGFDGFVLMDGPVDVFDEPGIPRVIYDRPFGGVLPAYHRLDASVERSFPLGRRGELTLQASVINVYDRANLFALDLFTLERTDQLPVVPTFGIKVSL